MASPFSGLLNWAATKYAVEAPAIPPPQPKNDLESGWIMDTPDSYVPTSSPPHSGAQSPSLGFKHRRGLATPSRSPESKCVQYPHSHRPHVPQLPPHQGLWTILAQIIL